MLENIFDRKFAECVFFTVEPCQQTFVQCRELLDASVKSLRQFGILVNEVNVSIEIRRHRIDIRFFHLYKFVY